MLDEPGYEHRRYLERVHLVSEGVIFVWDDPHLSLGERCLASSVHKGTKIAPVDDCRFAEPDFTRNKFDQFHQLTRIGSPLSLPVACWLYCLSLLHHYRLISQRHTTLLSESVVFRVQTTTAYAQ